MLYIVYKYNIISLFFIFYNYATYARRYKGVKRPLRSALKPLRAISSGRLTPPTLS